MLLILFIADIECGAQKRAERGRGLQDGSEYETAFWCIRKDPLTFPQLMNSTAASRKKKYTWSSSSRALTKSGAAEGRQTCYQTPS